LWTVADREGRLEYRPKKIKAACLPYDDCDIKSLIGQLESLGFVSVYAGSRYVQINNWAKHQNPHHREAASVIPSPLAVTVTNVTESPSLAEARLSSEVEACAPKPEPAVLIPDSLNLIPLTPNTSVSEHLEQSEEIYQEYPKQSKRIKSILEIRKALLVVDYETLLSAVKRFAIASASKDMQYIQDAANWFADGRWDDDPETWEHGAEKKTASPTDGMTEQERNAYRVDITAEDCRLSGFYPPITGGVSD
jgi:hypothetical protein